MNIGYPDITQRPVSRIDIRAADDWIALYISGEKVYEGHSISPRELMERLGIQFHWTDVDDLLDEHGGDPGEAFPESIHLPWFQTTFVDIT